MTGLRKFKVLDHRRHNPAVGILYESGSPLGRLLIVGMSHYGGDHVKRPQFTHDLLTEVIAGKRRIPYFTKIAGLFRDSNGRPYSPTDFYSSVAFYNFMPGVFKVRQAPTKGQWLDSKTQEFFFRVVDELKPERILVTGEQLWRALPSRLPGSDGVKRVCEDGTGLDVQFAGKDAECCWYTVNGAADCMVGAITHPSTRKFTKNRKDIGDWLRQFMTWTTRTM